MELKEKCKYIRECLKISQRKLAEMINTNQNEISFIERGFIPKAPQIEGIEKIYIDLTTGGAKHTA